MNTQYSFNTVLTRIHEKVYFNTGPIVIPFRKPTYSREREEKHTYYESLVPRSVITILPSLCGPPLSIHIRARFFITAFRPAVYFREKYDDLSLTHAEGLFGICMQGALNAVRVRKNKRRRIFRPVA